MASPGTPTAYVQEQGPNQNRRDPAPEHMPDLQERSEVFNRQIP